MAELTLDQANEKYPLLIEEMLAKKEGCECDRPDERENPHRHDPSIACVYWLLLKEALHG